MIQRIQTLWLAIVAVLAALILFFPIIEFQGEAGNLSLHVFEIQGAQAYSNLPNPSIIGYLTAIMVIVSVGSIFQFKNRKLQIRINMVTLLINIALLFVIFYYGDSIAQNPAIDDTFVYTYGSWFPVASVLFLILANRSIRKDEALVKQSERLR